VQNIMVGRRRDTSLADKFCVTAFYPALKDELEEHQKRIQSNKPRVEIALVEESPSETSGSL